MKKRFGLCAATALTALVALGSGPATGASHREAPAITERPKLDNTDFYMFRAYAPGRQDFVTLIANFQPAEDPGSGPNYYTMDPDGIYEIHIDNTGDAIEDLTFQFRFTNTLRNGTGQTVTAGGVTLPVAIRQTGQVTMVDDPDLGEIESYTVTQITGGRRAGTRSNISNNAGGATSFRKPFDNVGRKTIPDYATYAAQFINDIAIPNCAQGGRVFVGQRAEAFAINLGPVFDLVNFVPIQGAADPIYSSPAFPPFPGGITQSDDNQELVGKKNVTSIAIEVPISCLRGAGNGVIGGWSTASLPQARLLRTMPTFAAPDRNGGAFVQVSRLGNPLVNELVIGLPSKDLFNAAQPRGDAALAQFVTNPTFPEILNILFREPVNATLGTSLATLAPSNFPRNDLVATFLTGIRTLNQQATVTPSEILRLNTAIPPTPLAAQNPLGVVGNDLAGFPNGRRPGDDVTDIVLRVAMGRLCHPVPISGTQTALGLCNPADAPTGLVAYTDGAPSVPTRNPDAFPYLNTPLRGSPRPQTTP